MHDELDHGGHVGQGSMCFWLMPVLILYIYTYIRLQIQAWLWVETQRCHASILPHVRAYCLWRNRRDQSRHV